MFLTSGNSVRCDIVEVQLQTKKKNKFAEKRVKKMERGLGKKRKSIHRHSGKKKWCERRDTEKQRLKNMKITLFCMRLVNWS